MEATKNICCVKGEGTVDHSTVFAWVERLGKPKTVDSETVLQNIMANLANSTQKVSGKFNISQPKHLDLPNCAFCY